MLVIEVYVAVNEEIEYEELGELEEKWRKKYPFAIKIWEKNWDVLSPFFKFPYEIRKIIYTTNAIESLHR
jgi:putative transposase